ncbi:MAG: retroviral-like aspartic protease family protein [Methanosarcinales archaeon]
MGKVIVKTKIKSYEDEVRARLGLITSDQIRQVEIDALVDTGATMLVLPRTVVDRLGLPTIRKVYATYANGQKEKKDVAGGLIIEIDNRFMTTDCVIEEGDKVKPLIGQIVLEGLDLNIDTKKQKLVPRPESPDLPMMEIYSRASRF